MKLSLTLKALKYFYINQETKVFFPFVIIINVLVSSFSLILIGLPMLWANVHFIYFTLAVQGSNLDVKLKKEDFSS